MTYTVASALLLDLDGTIRYSRSGKYIESVDDIALFDGVEERIWSYKDAGWLVFGVTNQGGVAAGIKTLAEVNAENNRTRNLFKRDPFDEIVVAPAMLRSVAEFAGNPFSTLSLLRKPNPGMPAVCEWLALTKFRKVIHWDKSLMVGDMGSDNEMAMLVPRLRFAQAEDWRAGDALPSVMPPVRARRSDDTKQAL